MGDYSIGPPGPNGVHPKFSQYYSPLTDPDLFDKYGNPIPAVPAPKPVTWDVKAVFPAHPYEVCLKYEVQVSYEHRQLVEVPIFRPIPVSESEPVCIESSFERRKEWRDVLVIKAFDFELGNLKETPSHMFTLYMHQRPVKTPYGPTNYNDQMVALRLDFDSRYRDKSNKVMLKGVEDFIAKAMPELSEIQVKKSARDWVLGIGPDVDKWAHKFTGKKYGCEDEPKFTGGLVGAQNVGATASSLSKLLPGVLELVKHPVTGQKTNTLQSTIINLNDQYKWTREQIADWIETLDIDTTFKGDPNDGNEDKA